METLLAGDRVFLDILLAARLMVGAKPASTAAFQGRCGKSMAGESVAKADGRSSGAAQASLSLRAAFLAAAHATPSGAKPSPTTNVRPGKTLPKTLKPARGPVVPVSGKDLDRPAARRPSSRPVCLRIPPHHARETDVAAPALNTGVWLPGGAIASAFGTTLSPLGPLR